MAAEAIAGELSGLPPKARRTITHDNGGEFARHEAVTDAIGLQAVPINRGPRGDHGISTRSGASMQSRLFGPAASVWTWKQWPVPITGDGAETIRVPPYSPIQSTCR